MKYLKFLVVIILMLTLVACSSSKDTEDKSTKEEEKSTATTETEEVAEEDTEETEDIEEVDEEDIDDSTMEEGTVEEESESDEYMIGEEQTPILGKKSIEFLEEVKDRKDSTKNPADITSKLPKESNYEVELDILIEVNDAGESSYDAVVTKALIDEKEPVKIYSENADKNSGEFSQSAYEENNKGYVFDGGQWNEAEIPEGKHVIFGLSNVVGKILNDNADELSVKENDNDYFLEYAGEENAVTKQLSELFNFTYEGADIDTLTYNLVASIDKETNELTDFILISKVDGQTPNQNLQIEVYGEYEDYGEHPSDTIQKPEGL